MSEGYQFLANGLCKGAAYALLAVGFALISATARVFHAAHGAIYTIAGCAFYVLVVPIGCPIILAGLGAVLVAASAGAAMEALVYRPLRRRSASTLAIMISSVALYAVVVNSLAMIGGNQARDLHLSGRPALHLGNVILSSSQITGCTISLVVIGIYWLFSQKTRLGALCRAVADNDLLATSLGVPVERVRTLALVAGSALAAIAAIITAVDVGVDPQAGFQAFIVSAVACIIGGVQRPLGPVGGAILVGVLQGLVSWRTSTKWESAVTSTLLIAFLFARPQGLFAMTRRVGEE